MNEPDPKDVHVPVTIKADRQEVIAWEAAAAAAAGMSRQAWCRAVLNAASEVSALPKQLQSAQRAAVRLRKSRLAKAAGEAP
ncbi:MAG TPA: hypothetical protein VGO53_16185 [Steroidobacteraceae bacterium]|jgi:hypothetical protein|nr:hypothetical protein [Steroidobacteraceae bacterium]